VTARSASTSWPAEAASVPAARRFVRAALVDAGLAELTESAELLVSELVGNVVLHVGGNVEVRVHGDDEGVLVEVSDRSPVSPALRTFSQSASTGRGMRLVHSLSAEHGVRAHGDGKTIWVRLTAAAADRDDGDLAAAFADVDWLAELEQPEPAVGSDDSAERACLRVPVRLAA